MENFTQLFKVAALKMTPFIKSVIIYFMIGTFEHHEQVWSTVLKCIPIICLMAFIFLYDFKLTKEYRYSQKILLGLIFSCMGDALLNWNMFPHGMAAFGVAQICYISAFGFKPLRLNLGLPLYITGLLSVMIIFTNLKGVLVYGLPIYSILLLTMAWRSITRHFEDTSNLTRTFCAVGSLLFVISDSLIAFNLFYMRIPYAQILIMVTYYLAQFGITLSIVDLKSIKDKNVVRKVKSKKVK